MQRHARFFPQQVPAGAVEQRAEAHAHSPVSPLAATPPTRPTHPPVHPTHAAAVQACWCCPARWMTPWQRSRRWPQIRSARRQWLLRWWSPSSRGTTCCYTTAWQTPARRAPSGARDRCLWGVGVGWGGMGWGGVGWGAACVRVRGWLLLVFQVGGVCAGRRGGPQAVGTSTARSARARGMNPPPFPLPPPHTHPPRQRPPHPIQNACAGRGPRAPHGAAEHGAGVPAVHPRQRGGAHPGAGGAQAAAGARARAS